MNHNTSVEKRTNRANRDSKYDDNIGTRFRWTTVFIKEAEDMQ